MMTLWADWSSKAGNGSYRLRINLLREKESSQGCTDQIDHPVTVSANPNEAIDRLLSFLEQDRRREVTDRGDIRWRCRRRRAA